MPAHTLEEMLDKKSAEFAEALQKAAQKATKEEEIRIATVKQLAFLEQKAGILLQGQHEFTLAKGRVDSVYDRVIVEYKNPKSPSDRIGKNLSSAGSAKLVEQIRKRFADMRDEHGHKLNTLLGVGIDGRRIIFVRFRHGDWDIQEPLPFNGLTAKRFLWALFNLGQKGKPFSPDYLAQDFGSGSALAREGIRTLYYAALALGHPRSVVMFEQWKILFGEVCGYDVANPVKRIRELAEFYEVDIASLDQAALLFAVHTYYALFMKLLASEIVAYFHSLPTPLQRILKASSGVQMRKEITDLEAGSIFRHLNISNFLEGDLFAWYTNEWSSDMERMVQHFVSTLDDYNPGTLSEDPTRSRDLLKQLYQKLFPKSVRHDLGEYYTPDWLADFVLEKAGYSGDPLQRILDPACGSGTFLVMVINRIRFWYESNRDTTHLTEGQLAKKILANVVGFDLNPLAVMAARTNYLIAIRDLIGHVDQIEIPIYLCDSIVTPSEYGTEVAGGGDLFSGQLGTVKELSTAAGKFRIPKEITTKRDDIATYAEELESCIANSYSATEFVERCVERNLPISEHAQHMELYDMLAALNSERKNGIWARIIKNAFAPLFISKVDFLIGNPPWINWESLPAEYRKTTASLWQDYGLFRHRGYKARLGGAKDDLSILFTYVGHDKYLKDSGRLGFVITQSVFKTKGGGQGFRTFEYHSGERKRHFSPISVDDFSAFQPFEGATNRTATIIAGKSHAAVKYPIAYSRWIKKKGETALNMGDDLATASTKMQEQQLIATPVSAKDLLSPWLTVRQASLKAFTKIRGSADNYKSRKGVYCATNAVFWVKVEKYQGKTAIVTNLSDTGKRKVAQVTRAIEKRFVYALVRGKDVGRWRWNSTWSIILPQAASRPSTAVPDAELKIKYPKTYAYFKQFEDDLRGCALLKQFFDPESDPFYSSYNVGDYTFEPHKVVWKEVSKEISAAVLGTDSSSIIPDHKLVLTAVDSDDHAHFLCAVLNSLPVRALVRAYGIQTSISGHIFEYAIIPVFDSTKPLHRRLSDLSRVAHKLAAEGDMSSLEEIEQEIDVNAAKLWKLTVQEVAALRTESI